MAQPACWCLLSLPACSVPATCACCVQSRWALLSALGVLCLWSLSPLAPPRLVPLCSLLACCDAISRCRAACFCFFFTSVAFGSEPPLGSCHSLTPQRSRSPRRRQPRVSVRAQGKWGCGGGPGLLRGKEAWLPNLLSASSSSALILVRIGCLHFPLFRCWGCAPWLSQLVRTRDRPPLVLTQERLKGGRPTGLRLSLLTWSP